MDKPDFPGMGICRVGTADSEKVRLTVRGATVSFLEQHLLGAAVELPRGPGLAVRVKPSATTSTRR
jgi:hypothetical protein